MTPAEADARYIWRHLATRRRNFLISDPGYAVSEANTAWPEGEHRAAVGNELIRLAKAGVKRPAKAAPAPICEAPAPIAVTNWPTSPATPAEPLTPTEPPARVQLSSLDFDEATAPLRAMFPEPDTKPTARAKRAEAATWKARIGEGNPALAEARELNRGLKLSKHWRTMRGNY